MRVAFLTTDSREHFRDYNTWKPYFGTAPAALIYGFGMLADHPDAPEIHVISCTQKRIHAPEKLSSNIWFHSLRVPKSGWLRSAYLGCALAVRTKLKEIHPDLVHAQGTERDCALSAVLSPYPRLLTIHGNLRLIKKQVGFRPFSAMWLQSYLEGLVVPHFNGVICITNYTREAIEDEVPKTWVVPNAVDPSFLALGEKRMRRHEVKSSEINDSGFRSRVSGLESPPVILCVANIEPRKNQNAFITALDPLKKQMGFEVRFFGSCGNSAYAREFTGLIACRSWCHYGGMIGREELRDQLKQADILVLPTHEDNCPMVVLEAMAAGVPVLASKVGGIPDLIDDGTTGIFCIPEDPESLRAGVMQVLRDPGAKKSLAAAAHVEAMRRFHPVVIARRHLEIYREVLGL